MKKIFLIAFILTAALVKAQTPTDTVEIDVFNDSTTVLITETKTETVDLLDYIEKLSADSVINTSVKSSLERSVAAIDEKLTGIISKLSTLRAAVPK